MSDISFQPIGTVRTPYTDIADMPIQSVAARGVAGRIELLPEYLEGLADVEGFSHLWLIYHLHLVSPGGLTVTPFLDSRPHGIFATRSPRRPNAIGLSVVRLIGVDGRTLHIEDVDMLDGTPLLDIKPFVPAFDHRDAERIGWFEGNVERVSSVRADRRFGSQPPAQAGSPQGGTHEDQRS